MNDSPPTWSAFAADAPPALSDEPGRVVAVLAAPSAEAWAPDVAVGLARAWGTKGRRVVLFDGGLTSPSLHPILGRQNDEGLTDAVVYGASVGRVARRIEGEPLFFVPAGTVVADPRAVLEHPRWAGMCRGFLQAGATLVVFLPAAEPGADLALADATDLVVLAPEGEDAEALAGGHAGRLRAVLGPEAEGAPAGPSDTTDEADAAAAEASEVFAGFDEASGDDGDADGGVVPDPGLDADASASDDGFEEGLGQAAAPAGDPLSDPWAASHTTDDAEADDADFFDPLGEAPPVPGLPDGPEGGEDAANEDDDEAGFVADLDMVADPDPDPADGSDEAPGPDEGDPDPADDPDFADPLLGEAADVDPLAAPPPAMDDDDSDPHPPVPTADEIIAEAGDAPVTPAGRAAEAMVPSHAGGSRRMLGLLVVLLIVAGLAVAWWLGFLTIPGLGAPGGAAQLDAGTAPLTAAEAPRPERLTPPDAVAAPAAYSVALEAHADAEVAGQRIAELTAAAPGYLWTLAPVALERGVFHRVLVGPAADEVGAAALARRIAEEGGMDASEWLVRPTPLAFLVHEDPDLDGALGHAASLGDQGLPAYVLAVGYSDGATRYRVYSGAYADTAEASHLAGVFQERGLTATLTERIGVLP